MPIIPFVPLVLLGQVLGLLYMLSAYQLSGLISRKRRRERQYRQDVRLLSSGLGELISVRSLFACRFDEPRMRRWSWCSRASLTALGVTVAVTLHWAQAIRFGLLH